jgi:hypothetical protein
MVGIASTESEVSISSVGETSASAAFVMATGTVTLQLESVVLVSAWVGA